MKARHVVFVKNAAVLTITSVILRTVGIVFRIYLSGTIGAEGMGLYQLIVSIYVLASTFATSGISTAVTRLIADEMVCGSAATVRRILHRSVWLSLGLGVASAALIIAAAPLIGTYWFPDTRAIPALRILVLSLPSMGISSCLRGYLIARRRARETSYAQLLEQAVRIGLIFVLLRRVAKLGLSAACFAVLLGDTIAEWVSCGFLALRRWHDDKQLQLPSTASSKQPVVRRLLAIAAPITIGRYVGTVLRTVENLLVPNRIARYSGSTESGLSQFGALKGMALPLIFFPASFLSALSVLLIPELSSANAAHRHLSIQRAVERTLRLTTLAAILIGAVFFLFADDIGVLLYNSEDVGRYLRVLAPLTPIMYTESMVDGILKGLDQQVSSLRYSILDSAVRVVLILAVVPHFGMDGFLGIMVVSNLLTSTLNTRRLIRVTGIRWHWGGWVFLPLCGVAFAAVLTNTVLHLPVLTDLNGIFRAVTGILCLSLLYGIALFATGCLRPSDLKKANV